MKHVQFLTGGAISSILVLVLAFSCSDQSDCCKKNGPTPPTTGIVNWQVTTVPPTHCPGEVHLENPNGSDAGGQPCIGGNDCGVPMDQGNVSPGSYRAYAIVCNLRYYYTSFSDTIRVPNDTTHAAWINVLPGYINKVRMIIKPQP